MVDGGHHHITSEENPIIGCVFVVFLMGKPSTPSTTRFQIANARTRDIKRDKATSFVEISFTIHERTTHASG